MSDKGIIFSAPMVRALLDGRKTMTRRVLKPQPEPDWHSPKVSPGIGVTWTKPNGGVVDRRAPYTVGDRLWVREACNLDGDAPLYRATDDGFLAPDQRWRSPIHMPRWASRLTLVVTDVRVQRLQEISEADARAEGVGVPRTHNLDSGPIAGVESVFDGTFCTDHRDAMLHAWQTLHGTGEWASNPWVAAISFDVHRENIDRLATPVSAKGAGHTQIEP